MFNTKDSQPTRRYSRGWRRKRRNLMVACNKLRIDPNDGTAVEEYRIEDESVERRIFSAQGCPSFDSRWQRLTPDQIAAHVMAGTVVAHWLLRRMGIHALVRACNQHSSSLSKAEHRWCQAGEPITGEFSQLFMNTTQTDPG